MYFLEYVCQRTGNGYSFRYGKADSIILTGIRIRVLSEYDDFHFFERARVEDMENLMAGR